MKIIKLKPQQKTIFNSLLELSGIDYITSENVDTLNTMYYSIHAYLKDLSDFYEYLIKEEDEEEIVSANDEIAKVIKLRFKDKWNKIYSALLEEYNPLENYNMLQEETPDVTKTRKTNTATDITTSTSSNSENGVVGFNSTLPNKATTSKQTGQVNVTGDSLSNQEDVEETETGKRTLTRSGNIGVTTSQQMLESELKLREYDFYLIVFKDLDKILCSQTYNF